MAIFRNVQMSFWTDTKIMDDFTPKDKYFYLYLMTNPHTNLSGCYEISIKQMADETGYTKEVVEKEITQVTTVHKVASYSKDTKEMLLINWNRYNWTSSEKFRKPLLKEIKRIKNPEFRKYLTDVFNGIDTVSIPYLYPIDTTVTVTDTNISNISSIKPFNNTIGNNIYFPDDEIMNQYFIDYINYRKEIKKPLTDRSLKMQVKNLIEYSTVDGIFDRDIAKKILDNSIANGWQGLFPLKPENKKSPSKTSTTQKSGTNYDELAKELMG